MLVRTTCRAVLPFLIASISCQAQQSTLTVDAVLSRVQEHLVEYKTSVPSFVSDESRLSQRFVNEKLKDEVKIESSFEVKRRGAGEDMRETRTAKLVNGKVAKSQKISMPYFVNGGVGLQTSLQTNLQTNLANRCFDFHFADVPSTGNIIVIQSSPKPASSDHPSDCPSPSSNYSIKANIDPQTFQVSRIETTFDTKVNLGKVGHPALVPSHRSDNNNTMIIDVDYAPVELGTKKTYWLTKTVTSEWKDNDDRKNPVHLHYEAHYSNYHKFTSTVTILPGDPVTTQN
jgi:hypothetical protein